MKTGLLIGAALGAVGGMAGVKLIGWPLLPALGGGVAAGAVGGLVLDKTPKLTRAEAAILASSQLVIPGALGNSGKFKIPTIKKKKVIATNQQLATISAANIWRGPSAQWGMMSQIALAGDGLIKGKKVSKLDARKWIMDRMFVQASIGLDTRGGLIPGGSFRMTPNAAIVFARNWLLAEHGAVQGTLKSADIVRTRNMLRVALLVNKRPTMGDMGKKMHGMTYGEWFNRTSPFPAFMWPMIRVEELVQLSGLLAPHDPGKHWKTSDVWLGRMTQQQLKLLQTDLGIFIQEMMRRRVHKWPLGPAPAPTIDWGSIGLLFLGVAAAAVLAPVTGGGSLAATALVAATGTVAAADAYMESQGKSDETTQTLLDGMTIAEGV